MKHLRMPLRGTTFFSRLLIVTFTVLIFACDADDVTEEFVEKPANLLNQDQMVAYLIDMHLLEAKMSYAGIGKADSTEQMFRNYEAYLFEKHGFSDTAYYKSYEYYLAHMEQMDKIYEAVVDSLSVLNTIEKADD